AIPYAPSLETQQLAGGSGTVSIPHGWRLASSTPTAGATIDGPAGQRIVLGGGVQVVDPRTQVAQMLVQSGQRDSVLMAPLSAPAQALTALWPQLNRMSARAGQPTETLDRILEVSPLGAVVPGGTAQAVHFAT